MSINEIRESMKKKQLVIGRDKVIKGLKSNKIRKVFLSSNCPEYNNKEIGRYAQFSSVEVVDAKKTNLDLGVLCKKPFSISVLGLLK